MLSPFLSYNMISPFLLQQKRGKGERRLSGFGRILGDSGDSLGAYRKNGKVPAVTFCAGLPYRSATLLFPEVNKISVTQRVTSTCSLNTFARKILSRESGGTLRWLRSIRNRLPRNRAGVFLTAPCCWLRGTPKIRKRIC